MAKPVLCRTGLPTQLSTLCLEEGDEDEEEGEGEGEGDEEGDCQSLLRSNIQFVQKDSNAVVNHIHGIPVFSKNTLEFQSFNMEETI